MRSEHALDSRAALLIVDVQRAMDSPVWGERNNPALIPNLQRALAGWRRCGRPIYWIADDSTRPESPYYPGQPGNKFFAELAPVEGESVVRKSTGSAFIGTDLEAQLRRAGCQTLVVGGFMTNKCVDATVRVAADLGFTVYVLADGAATVGQADHRGRWWEAEDVHSLALANLESDAVRVVSVDELLANFAAAP